MKTGLDGHLGLSFELACRSGHRHDFAPSRHRQTFRGLGKDESAWFIVNEGFLRRSFCVGLALESNHCAARPQDAKELAAR